MEEDLKTKLKWFATSYNGGDPSAVAGMVVADAVERFDRSSAKLANRMLLLTIVLGVLTVVQISVAVYALLVH